ncbi:MAG: S41 family peptidase, partial [Candidatus Sulfotelmatobacter sp.]
KLAFVLTSASTFSGAEEFTYDLKMLKRATIVGETTAGGSHMASRYRIDDHFMMMLPDTRPINPVSKTDWEGTGVEPDASVDAADALATAKKLAETKLQKK